VALKHCCAYRYLFNANILLNSESQEELQWLWENQSKLSLSNSQLWQFYAQRNFAYVAIPQSRVDDALQILNDNHIGGEVVFVGKDEAVLRIGAAQRLRDKPLEAL
jgi:hypothetical protein